MQRITSRDPLHPAIPRRCSPIAPLPTLRPCSRARGECPPNGPLTLAANHARTALTHLHTMQRHPVNRHHRACTPSRALGRTARVPSHPHTARAASSPRPSPLAPSHMPAACLRRRYAAAAFASRRRRLVAVDSCAALHRPAQPCAALHSPAQPCTALHSLPASASQRAALMVPQGPPSAQQPPRQRLLLAARSSPKVAMLGATQYSSEHRRGQPGRCSVRAPCRRRVRARPQHPAKLQSRARFRVHRAATAADCPLKPTIIDAATAHCAHALLKVTLEVTTTRPPPSEPERVQPHARWRGR